MKRFAVNTSKRTEFIDITVDLNRILTNSECKEGIMVVFTPHTTAGITINENADPDVRHDLDHKINSLVPKDDPNYRHVEGNSDSHMKSSLFSPSMTLIIKNGRLQLGTWQSVYFCEFDGPRNRELFVKIVTG